MGEAFFTEVTGPDPVRRPRRRRSAGVQGLPAGPPGPRQADGGPPPARRLLLALVRLGRAWTCSGSARSTGRGSRPTDDEMAAARHEDGRRVRVLREARHAVLLLPRPRRRARGRRASPSSAPTSTRSPTTPPATRSGPACGCCGARPTCSRTRATRRGAATNPDPEVFAYAAAQVKHMLEVTQRLGGENYVLWGGREGYDTLLNTDLKREGDQLARFLHLVVEHKHKIGFEGQLLIEPKPMEPTKHQYDYDVADGPRLPRPQRARGRVPAQHRGQPRDAGRPQLPPRGRVRGRQRDAGQHRRQPRRPAERLGHRPVPELGRGPGAAAVRDPARRRARARRLQLRRQAAPPEHRPRRPVPRPHRRHGHARPGAPRRGRPDRARRRSPRSKDGATPAGTATLGTAILDGTRVARRSLEARVAAGEIDPVRRPAARSGSRTSSTSGSGPPTGRTGADRRAYVLGHRRLDDRDQGRPRRRDRRGRRRSASAEYGFEHAAAAVERAGPGPVVGRAPRRRSGRRWPRPACPGRTSRPSG